MPHKGQTGRGETKNYGASKIFDFPSPSFFFFSFISLPSVCLSIALFIVSLLSTFIFRNTSSLIHSERSDKYNL